LRVEGYGRTVKLERFAEAKVRVS